MANEVLVKNGTPIVWADTTDYSAAGSGYTRTHQLDLTSLANGDAREGAKADFGEKRAARCSIRVGAEIDVAPVAGARIDYYLSASADATAAVGNDAGAAGADQAYKAGEQAEWLRQAIYLGSLICTADAATTVQRGTLGEFSPPERYGSIIVHNLSGQALEGDAVEMYVAFVWLVDEVQ